jgi:hypothetical protein
MAKDKRREVTTSSSEPPRTFREAVLAVIWQSKWRFPILIFAAALMLLFGLWKSLPDDVKNHWLGKKSEPAPSVSTRDIDHSTVVVGDGNKVKPPK